MELKKILSYAWHAIVILFVIKGLLSDIGYTQRFDQEAIYTFTYLAFAMSSIMWYDAYLLKGMKNE